jgi:Effector Associated Constant Component 1
VDAEIRVPSAGSQSGQVDGVGELAALLEWLRSERGLSGAVREVRVPPGPGELSGGAVEALVVAVGAGGAAGTLARSLFGWLLTRRPNLKITVTTDRGSVTVEANQVRDGDVLPMLREVLEPGDGL